MFVYVNARIYRGATGWSIASPFLNFGVFGETYTGDNVITTSLILLSSFALVLFLVRALKYRNPFLIYSNTS